MITKEDLDKALAANKQDMLSLLEARNSAARPAIDPNRAVHENLHEGGHGSLLGRLIMMKAAAKYNNVNERVFAENVWGKKFAEALDTVSGFTVRTDTVADGGAAIDSPVSGDIIEPLRAASVVMSAGPRGIDMMSGQVSIPKLTTGVSGSWIGEAEKISASSPAWGNVVALSKKVAVLVPVSNDWIRRKLRGADMFVRDDAAAALGEAIDLAYLQGTGTQYTPKGLKNWAGQSVTANATANVSNIAQDFGSAFRKVEEGIKRAPRKPAIFWSPRSREAIRFQRDNAGFGFFDQIAGGRLMGVPFYTSAQIPNNLSTNKSYILYGDMDAVVIGSELNIRIEQFDQGAYVDGSGNTVSAVQQDLTLIRVIAETDLVVRHSDAWCVIDSVGWGA